MLIPVFRKGKENKSRAKSFLKVNYVEIICIPSAYIQNQSLSTTAMLGFLGAGKCA